MKKALFFIILIVFLSLVAGCSSDSFFEECRDSCIVYKYDCECFTACSCKGNYSHQEVMEICHEECINASIEVKQHV